MKQFITLVTAFAIFNSPTHGLHADDVVNCPNEEVCCPEECGYAFENCRTAPRISPTLALGAVALIAVITVIAYNNNNKKSRRRSSSNTHNSGVGVHSHS
ncbi:MAG: hypothetical protein WB791_02380 [Waddliaceae bacterium]